MTIANCLLKKLVIDMMFKLIVAVLCVFVITIRTEAPPRIGKIVGGENATEGQFPYQLSILWYGSHLCAASIIGESLAITAAHCVASDPAESFKVVAGKIIRSETGPNEQILSVDRIVVHELFEYSAWWSYDIALLHLNGSFLYNNYVQPIRLPSQGQSTTGLVTISGWGSIAEGELPADNLRWVILPIINDTDCQLSYPEENIEPNMLCTGLPSGGKDACDGDNGGPVVAFNGYLAGIVSWGYGCGRSGNPKVHTEVSFYVDWITQNS